MFEVAYEERSSSPCTVVSFFTENDYYARAGAQLHEDLSRQGLSHRIYRLVLDQTLPWHAITKRKIDLYQSVRNHAKALRFDRGTRDRFARKYKEARLSVAA